jgi:hypothetical protein
MGDAAWFANQIGLLANRASAGVRQRNMFSRNC